MLWAGAGSLCEIGAHERQLVLQKGQAARLMSLGVLEEEGRAARAVVAVRFIEVPAQGARRKPGERAVVSKKTALFLH